MQSEDKMKQREWAGGAKRDSNIGKPRPDLIPAECLWRLGKLYAKGAEHYGIDNWKKGIPTASFVESAERHWLEYRMGMTNEDHLASLVFNVFGIMYNELCSTNDEKPTYTLIGDDIDPAWRFDSK